MQYFRDPGVGVGRPGSADSWGIVSTKSEGSRMEEEKERRDRGRGKGNQH